MKLKLPVLLLTALMASLAHGAEPADTEVSWTQEDITQNVLWKDRNVTIHVAEDLDFSGISTGGNVFQHSSLIGSDGGNLSFVSDGKKNMIFKDVVLSSFAPLDSSFLIFSSQKVSFDQIGDIVFKNISEPGKSADAVYGMQGISFTQTGRIAIKGLTAYTSQLATADGSVLFDHTGTIDISDNVSASIYSYGGGINTKGVTFSHVAASAGVDGTVILFHNNQAGEYGGAIFTDDAVFSDITGDIVFTENNVRGDGYNSAGGAIDARAYFFGDDYIKGGTVSFRNIQGKIVFKGNHVDAGDDMNGIVTDYITSGAIFADGGVAFENTGDIIIESNTSDGRAGAIESWGNEGISFKKTGNISISDNHAVQWGGALNTSHLSLEDIHGNVNISGNTAGGNGGAIANFNGPGDDLTIIRVDGNVIFDGNTSGGFGGAIGTNNKAIALSVIGGSVQFINNIAETDGGAIANYYTGGVSFSGVQKGILFKGNEALDYWDGNGGAIDSINEVVFTGNKGVILFEDNKAGNAGGAISSSAPISFVDNETVIFRNNTAGRMGSALSAGNGLTMTGNTGGITFEGNAESAAIYVWDGNLTLSDNGDVLFKDNWNQSFGGALDLAGGSHLLSADRGNIVFSGNYVNASPSTETMKHMNALFLHGDDAILTLQAVAGRTIAFYEGMYNGGDGHLLVNMTEDRTGDILFSGRNGQEQGGLLSRAEDEDEGSYQDRLLESRTFSMVSLTQGYGTLSLRDGAVLELVDLILEKNAVLDVGEGAILDINNWTVRDNARVVMAAGARIISQSDVTFDRGMNVDIFSRTVSPEKASVIDAPNLVLGGTLTLSDSTGTLYTATSAMGRDRTFSLIHDLNGTRGGTDFDNMEYTLPQYGYLGTWSTRWEDDKLMADWTFTGYFQPWNEFLGGAIYNSLWSSSTNLQSLSDLSLQQADRLRFLSGKLSNYWISGLGDFGTQRSSGQIDGFDYQGGGYAVGGDFSVASNHVLGAAFGQIAGKNKSRSYIASNDQDSLMGMLYAGGLVPVQKGSDLRYNLSVAYGSTSNKIDMYDSFSRRNSHGKWDNETWLLNSRIAWDKALCDTYTLSPFIGLEYTDVSSDAFSESGGDPRHFGKGSLKNLALPLGVTLSRMIDLGNDRNWLHAVTLSYSPDVYRHNPQGTVTVPNAEGWTARGVEVGRHAGVFGYNTRYQINENWSLYAGYNLEVREDAVFQNVKAGASCSF